MTINPHVMIDPATSLRISEYLQTAMLRAMLPEHRADVEKVVYNMPIVNESKKLGKVLAKLLAPFRTQEAGGFETGRHISQQSVENLLNKKLQYFDGLICGIEASAETVIKWKNQKRHGVLSQSAVVYPKSSEPSSVLSPSQRIQSSATKGTIHCFTSTNRPTVWMGHLDSGTSDPEKFPYNRALFLDVIRGVATDCVLDSTTDISFWDVNFDCTDRVNQNLNLPSTIQMLLQFTTEYPVQFIIPAVRVSKKRIAQRPFANNQIHKGGVEQVAESMIATCPNGMTVKALDEDGLYVLSEGTIRLQRAGVDTKIIPSIEAMTWIQCKSFSRGILLDHKPIWVALDNHSYAFHNFMDFKGSIGIRDICWYDRDRLAEEERAFMVFLQTLVQ